jgi:flagellar protein FlaJ
MALFKKKNEVSKQIIGFTKSKNFLGIKIKAKPIYGNPSQKVEEKISPFNLYVKKLALKYKDVELALREIGMREDLDTFLKKMIINSVITSIIIGIAIMALLTILKLPLIADIVIGLVIIIGFYQTLLPNFIRYPEIRIKNKGKDVEKDILFAARDIVVSMRSGMPLYNGIVTVSSGYGAASREFAKIIELVQLGIPIEEAIETISNKSQSKTFKKIMLQSSLSIRVGADVVGALQEVVEEVTQDRVIELRKYGQRLNAISMFYMLFGIILPSMGIAVATILTTFISIFTVNITTLAFIIIAIIVLQIIFLKLVTTSRPTFAM